LAGSLNLEEPLDLRQESGRGERLLQQGGRKLGVLLPKRGDEEQADASGLGQLPGQLDAVHTGHDDVGYDQFNVGICRQSLERFDAVARLQHPVALARESTHHQSAERRIVFDDKHGVHDRRPAERKHYVTAHPDFLPGECQTKMGITIRRGVATDASALAELAARTFRETFAADNRPEEVALHITQAYGPAQQGSELVDATITTLLVDADGQLAGYAQLRSGPAPECVTGALPLELWRFYIAQPWHGRGVAQALMQRVEVEARQRGGRTLWLGVWERNERAQAFYRKCGFADVGSHVFMVGTDPQTDRLLVRAVPTPLPDNAA
jgi:diamine N-acetyltransferase